VTTGVRPARADDAAALARIYDPYVRETTVTFEEVPVAPEEMAARLRAVLSSGLPWLVAEENGQVVGYACAVAWKSRAA
jgi:phosphinothricin acetyltransferase